MIDVTTDNLRLLGNSWLACRPKLGRESRERRLAEREGFEPPCRLPGKTLSRRPRYDHFGTSPYWIVGVPCTPTSSLRYARSSLLAPLHSRFGIVGVPCTPTSSLRYARSSLLAPLPSP